LWGSSKPLRVFSGAITGPCLPPCIRLGRVELSFNKRGIMCVSKGLIMKWRSFTNLLTIAILTGMAIATPGLLRAQAPAGPLPGAPPQTLPPSATNPQNAPRAETRTSILGRWKLNLDESDDPRKKMDDARTSHASGPRNGGVSIAGFPIGGHGGNRGGESDEERLQTQVAIGPANLLTIEQKDPKNPEVDVTDDQNRKRALFTDGRKIQKTDSKDDSYQEIAARWDGSRLVTDEKSPRGGKMSRTFELSYDGAQLYETLRLIVGRSNTPLDVRYVYDPVSSSAPPSNP
jgi:hypothetical protein